MKITAYPLSDQAVAIVPVPSEPAWAAAIGTVSADLALSTAGGKGWVFQCPYAFEATWNGGPSPDDIDIRGEGPEDDAPAFVWSEHGGGLLTFYSGYQFKTEAGALWVRGPINAPRDGLYPLESIVDTSLLPCTITVNWAFTRPNQTVRFEAGEPFGAILPHPWPATGAEPATLEVVAGDADVDAYEQALEHMIADPALQLLFQRLGGTPTESNGKTAPSSNHREITPSHWVAQLSDPPPLSCICPTYGRAALLEEAIESFLRQDYPGTKELIILNDYAHQTLEFDHPEVRIVNLPRRFSTVGEKYKAAAALASHELIFVWHDDDIYLPHRLSFSVARREAGKGFFKADKAWYWNEGQVSGPESNLFHGGSCWTRDLFVKLDGYPHIGIQYDIEFEQLAREEQPHAIQLHPIQPAEIYYLYRWHGTDSYHLSGMEQNGREHQQVAAYVQRQVEAGQVKQGTIALRPHWNSDYPALVRACLPDQQDAEPAARPEETAFPPPFFVIPPPPPVERAEQLFRGDYPARISVILPAANESVLLRRTVEQFAATLPPDSEVIVVDNGSTDGCADFLVEEPRANVHLIRTPDVLGVAGARNRGLEAARGEIVVFADAHIDVPERWWQPIVCVLNQPNVGVVGPGIGVMGSPERPAACGQRIAEAKLRVEWLSRQSDQPYPVPTLGGGFMAMRHDTLKAAGAFDAGMPHWGSEDLELCVRYWLLGYEVWVAPEVTVLHYFRTANPYRIVWGAVTHNLLRVALLHFSQDRIGRVLTALKSDVKFTQALAQAVETDVWQRRAEFAARRVRDDDWLFEKFSETCEV